MKKATLLLLSAAMLATGAGAQQLRRQSIVSTEKQAATRRLPSAASATAAQPRPARNVFAKGASTPFYTQTFNGGIPAGWSTASLTPGLTGSWRWANAAPSGSGNAYALTAINSTTASNGWMLYNSDSLGAVFAGSEFEGVLTSAPISCSGHNTVRVTFQQWFRRYNDSCFLEVSTNGGSSYTRFDIQPNNSISDGSYSGPNPTITNVNISSVAANQASVIIRFHYKCIVQYGGYNWDIDDMTLSELDPVDLSISKAGIVMPGSTSGFADLVSFTQIPLQFVDTLIPLAFLTNNGATASTNTAVGVKIFKGATQVYSQTATRTIPVDGYDSLVDMSANPYKPTSTGDYTVVFSINPAGDADLTNNQDTVRFSVTDTVYAPEGPSTTGSYTLHQPAGSGSGEISYYAGARFTINSNGGTDTLSSLSVSFASTTTPGAVVQGQIYKAISNGSGYDWSPIARTVNKTLTATDISTTTGLVYTTIPMVGVGALTNLKLSDGDYAAVITTVGATTQTVAILSTNGPFADAPVYVGYTGQSDTSNNNANYTFAAGGGIATGSVAVPRVRANFGRYRPTSSVGTIAGVTVSDAYPNPARTFINIPVAVKSLTNDVTITLTDVTGQVVRTHSMGTIGAGNTNIASISTADLANGVYIYTVSANGGRTAGRIVVAH